MSNEAIGSVSNSVLQDKKFATPEKFDQHVSNLLSELMDDIKKEKKIINSGKLRKKSDKEKSSILRTYSEENFSDLPLLVLRLTNSIIFPVLELSLLPRLGSISSKRLFQVPHLSHCPDHFDWDEPHS